MRLLYDALTNIGMSCAVASPIPLRSELVILHRDGQISTSYAVLKACDSRQSDYWTPGKFRVFHQNSVISRYSQGSETDCSKLRVYTRENARAILSLRSSLKSYRSEAFVEYLQHV